MNNQKSGMILSRLIAVLFAAFIGMLAVLSVFMHCETDIYDYGHAKSVVSHTPYIYGGLAAGTAVLVMLLCAFLERICARPERGEKAARIVFYGCGAALALAGICWILFHDELPFYDQFDVYQEARRLAGVLDEPFDAGYFSVFHRNRGIALFVSIAVRIFGDHLYSFQIFNLFAALLIYYSVCRASRLIFRNPVVEMLTSLMMLLCYPVIVYITFIYGTLWSIALTSLGLYGTAAWQETGKRRYAVIMMISFPLGILMHQSEASGFAASALYLVMAGGKKRLAEYLLVIALTAGLVFVSMKTVNMVYTGITGVSREADPIPVTCTIYMGLTSTEGSGGPGSQDGSYGDIFVENNRDGKAAGRDAVRRILTVTQEYLTGRRSLSFFLEKTQYQWLDPTFGARKIIRTEGAGQGIMAHEDAYRAFYDSPLRTAVFKFSTGGMLFLYCAVFVTGLYAVYDGKKYPQASLIRIYVLGGCAFQLLWESLSRYCLGYFIWLIPLAAAGGYMLYGKCGRRFGGGKLTEKIELNQKRE